MPPCVPSPARGVRPLVLLVLAMLGAGGRPAAAQRITPRFAWPAGGVAEVTTTTRTVATLPAGMAAPSDSTTLRMSMRMSVAADPRGFVVAFDDPRMGPATGPAAAVSAAFRGVLRMNSAPHVVTRDGRFVDYADTAAIMRQADSTLAVMRTQLAGLPPAIAEELKRATGLGMLRQAGHEFWARLAGDITERPWAPGDSAARIVRMPFPPAPGIVLDVPHVTRYDGVVACPGAGAGRCWRFTSREHISSAVMRPAMQRMMSAMGAGDTEFTDELMAPETETVRVLVVDAATLRPLREETTMRVTVVTVGVVSQVMTTVTEYAWR